MNTIRIGNDINVVWKVFSRNGLKYTLEDMDLTLWILSGPYKTQITTFQVEDFNQVTFSLDATSLTRQGVYKLLLRIKDPVAIADDAAFDLTQTFQIVSQSYPNPTEEPVDGAVDLTYQSILNTVFVSTQKGDRGESAYQVAVRNGFSGTEQEWLESLHAPLVHVTSQEIQAALNYVPVSPTQLATKVDKVNGKALSTNDFTDAYKTQLDSIDGSVAAAQAAAVTAAQTLSSLESLLEEAEVDESVISVATLAGQVASDEIQIKTNKDQVFGATKNYTSGKCIYSDGTAISSTGWCVSGYIDVSDIWLESGNTVNWYYGDNSNTNACICNYNDEFTKLTYKAASAGGSVNRSFSWDYPATKYLRMCYKATYTDAKLIVNGQVIWRPQDTVNGLVPQMSTANTNIDTLQTEVLRKQLTTKTHANTSMSGLTINEILEGGWFQKTAITMADVRDPINIRFRSTDRDKNRVLLEACSPGDMYVVNGLSAGYTNCLLWGFYDGDFVLMSAAEAGVTYTNHVITAPANAAYIAINWYHNDEEPATTPKFFKMENGTLRNIVEKMQQEMGGHGDGDILTFNPEKEMLPKIIASRRMKRNATLSPLTIAHFSDVHGKSAADLSRYIEFCEYYTGRIDVRLNTGDTVYNSFGDIPATQSEWWYRNTEGTAKIFNVVGNHDVASYSNSTYNWTAYVGAVAYSTYIAPFLIGWDVTSGGENTCYYYKDYPSAKVRLICLDMPGYDTTEDEWFSSLLASAIVGGYTVVVAAHFPGAIVNAFESPFTSLARNSTGDNTVSYMANQNLFGSAVKRVDNFITGGGSFACWLVGHGHYDFVSTVAPTQPGDISINNTQLVIMVETASSNSAQTTYSDIDHTAGTKLQDCFNLVTIDAELKYIKIVRVGCDKDRWMRTKDTLCLNYGTNTII